MRRLTISGGKAAWARVHVADGAEEVWAEDVFRKVGTGARLGGAEDIFFAVVGRKDDDFGLRIMPAELIGGLDSTDAREADIHEDDVR